MSMIAHSTTSATLYEADENGWSLQIRTSRTGKKMHVGRAHDASLVRFYSTVTITPEEKRLAVVMYDDCPVSRIAHLTRLAYALARRDGDWPGADWGRGQHNGLEWLSIKLGDPIDVNEAFAQLTERIDLSSEVHA